ncbi:MAG: hypothetical protein K2X47_17150 [Bdellovibrionales bacterium]|nr:hypothetical protein [Bdellovibrionales bacterium]
MGVRSTFGFVLMLASGVCHVAAAEKALVKEVYPALPMPQEMAGTRLLTSEQITEMVKKTTKRSTASADALESKLNRLKDYQTFRTAFHKVRDPGSLDRLIDAYLLDYNTKSPELKLVLIQLKLFKSMKSILPRLKPYFENNGSRISQNLAISGIRSLASGLKIYFPEGTFPHADAFMKYVSEPLDGMQPLIETNYQFQSLFSKEIYESIREAIVQLEELKVEEGGIVWDNQIFLGNAALEDGLQRFQSFEATEKYALLSFWYASLSNLAIAASYKWIDLMKISKELGVLYGFAEFKIAKFQGASARARFDLIRDAHPEFLSFDRVNGPKRLKDAEEKLERSSRYAEEAWKMMSKQDKIESEMDLRDSPQALMNPIFFSAFKEPFRKSIKKIVEGLRPENAQKGIPFRSSITGEVVQVNIRQFFAEPPNSLQVFWPRKDREGGFQRGEAEMKRSVLVEYKDESGKSRPRKQEVEFRNYLEGRAIAWDSAAYAKYFPGETDVPKIIRVMGQSFGGFWLGSALSAVAL